MEVSLTPQQPPNAPKPWRCPFWEFPGDNISSMMEKNPTSISHFKPPLSSSRGNRAVREPVDQFAFPIPHRRQQQAAAPRSSNHEEETKTTPKTPTTTTNHHSLSLNDINNNDNDKPPPRVPVGHTASTTRPFVIIQQQQQQNDESQSTNQLYSPLSKHNTSLDDNSNDHPACT